MKGLSDGIKKVSNISDKIAGVFIVSAMILVVTNVVLRAVFNHPIKGTYEIIGLLTAAAVAMGLGFCAFKKGHIAVEFIMEFLPKKVQLIVSILNNFIALCFWSIATVYLIKYGNTMMEKGLVTSTSEIPVYPFIYLISCGFLVLCFVLVTALREDVREIIREGLVDFKITETIREESI